MHPILETERNLGPLIWVFTLTVGLGLAMAAVLYWAINSVQRDRTRAAVAWGRRLLDGQEEERRGIARELHDGVVPLLESMGMELRRAGSADGAERASALAMQLRTLSRGLHPATLDHLPLADALQQLFATESTDAFEMTLDAGELPDLDFAHRLAGYRIVQEAVNNARRHAAATQVNVSLDATPFGIDIKIHDNGHGFVVPADGKLASLGLRSMRERASALGGTLHISSQPGKGTSVHAHFPLATTR
ncbi:MAG: sensor histidine kinase [Gemmatimonadota bacterium]